MAMIITVNHLILKEVEKDRKYRKDRKTEKTEKTRYFFLQ